MGIDTGSISINFAIIDERKKVVKTLYLRNQGIITTLQKGLKEIKNKRFNVKGVGITGSGKELTNILIGGDVIKNEILCHTVGTLNFIPDVKTVLEIGGEDSKLSIIHDNVLSDFSMNSICGGGCGAMIEAIASRMGIKIEDVGKLALKSKNNITLPGKCGIFCQSAVVSKLNTGANKEDLLMGVCRAMIKNYLAMLGKGKELKPPYSFQGGTSRNIGLKKALEEELDHKVIIPPYADCIGAIGAALLALEDNSKKTKFKGFEITNFKYKTENFTCNHCPNRCEITKILQNNKIIAFMGSKCGRWHI